MGLQRQTGRASGIWIAAGLSATLLTGGALRVWASVSLCYVGKDEAKQGQAAQGRASNLVDSINLIDAPLSIAIRLIEQKSGINIVFTPQEHGYSNVTLSVKDKPVSEVLRLIAQSSGADLWEEEGIYFIGPKGSAPKKPAPPEPASGGEADNTTPSAPVRWEKIRLMYTEPQTILHHLGVRSGPLQDAEEQMTTRAMRFLLDNQTPYSGQKQFGSGIQILPNGQTASPGVPTGTQVPDINQVANPGGNGQNGTNLGGIGQVPGGSGSDDQGAHRDGGSDRDEFGRGGGQLGPPRGGGFGGGGGGQFGGGGGGGQFGGGGGGQAGGAGAGAAAGLLPTGMNPGDLFAYDADNSIIVRYTDPAVLRQLRDVIRLLDVKPRQIMLRAEFVTVTQNDINSFGINWSFQRVNLIGGANTGFSSTNTAFLQFASGNFQVQLSWILTTGHGKLVTSPMATTLNNVPATFINTQLVPVFISTPVALGTGTVILNSTIVPLPVSTGLIVLPRINGDESITLFGTVFVSDVAGTATGPNGQSFPLISAQTAPVQRVIRNGDTMVIAGLLQKHDIVSTNRVPLLGDLPLIGSLFRSRSVSTDDSEVLVFITPTIIPERAPLTAPGGGVGAGGLGPAGPGGGGGALP